MRIVLWSDTHGLHDRCAVPDGDLLLYAGDLGRHGTMGELADFNRFLGRLPHRRKILIAGNRDFFFEQDFTRSRSILTNAEYLQDEETVIDGIRIFGSPWQPPFMNTAFNVPRGELLRAKWSLIPEGIDILITHTPPLGKGDALRNGHRVGCRDLSEAVYRIRPKLHVFGHVHEGYGEFADAGILFVNASATDGSMQLAHSPITVEWPWSPPRRNGPKLHK